MGVGQLGEAAMRKLGEWIALASNTANGAPCSLGFKLGMTPSVWQTRSAAVPVLLVFDRLPRQSVFFFYLLIAIRRPVLLVIGRAKPLH